MPKLQMQAKGARLKENPQTKWKGSRREAKSRNKEYNTEGKNPTDGRKERKPNRRHKGRRPEREKTIDGTRAGCPRATKHTDTQQKRASSAEHLKNEAPMAEGWWGGGRNGRVAGPRSMGVSYQPTC